MILDEHGELRCEIHGYYGHWNLFDEFLAKAMAEYTAKMKAEKLRPKKPSKNEWENIVEK